LTFPYDRHVRDGQVGLAGVNTRTLLFDLFAGDPERVRDYERIPATSFRTARQLSPDYTPSGSDTPKLASVFEI
jgi:hypothetical protein